MLERAGSDLAAFRPEGLSADFGLEGSQYRLSDIQAQEILKIRERLNEIISRHSGQTVDKIKLDSERDRFMGPTEAVEYGLVDKILDKRTVAPPPPAAL